jgi:3-polyprenyl-4-hydroxybenzoate decarboxylase
LMAIEPQTGKRLAQVRAQRAKLDYAQFMKALAAAYPKARKIHVVQDNLNTHDVSAFYETLDQRVSHQEDMFTGRKVPPLLAKMEMNTAPSSRQGGT